MGKKISSDVEKILARAYLTGKSRDETAIKANVSTGSVSNYWVSFRELIGAEGETIRDLSIKLNRIRLSIEQASLGAEIMNKLKNMDVSVSKFESFVSSLYQESINQGHAPKQIVALADELYRLKALTGVSYEELFRDFKAKKEELSKLGQEITVKQKEREKAIEDTKKALEEKDATIKVLNEYSDFKGKLEQYGYKINDFFMLSKIFDNAKEQDYDVKKILEFMSQTSSLSNEYMKIGREVIALRLEKSTLNKEINDLKAERSTLLDSINRISDSTVPQIGKVAKEANKELEMLKTTTTTSMQEIRHLSEAQRSELVSSAQESIKKLEGILGEINPAIDRLSKAQKIGKEIGEFEALYPMFKLFSEKEVSEQEMLPILKVTLYRFIQWLILKKVDSDLKEKTEALLICIDGQI